MITEGQRQIDDATFHHNRHCRAEDAGKLGLPEMMGGAMAVLISAGDMTFTAPSASAGILLLIGVMMLVDGFGKNRSAASGSAERHRLERDWKAKGYWLRSIDTHSAIDPIE